MELRVITLGAGQDVGKSCVVVMLGGKTVMFDCGMHMGYTDERRFPDFSLLTKSGDFTGVIDAVVITHFHLDHVGALPFFTEVLGYNGPVYMTYPTKAIVPLMLDDYHRVITERSGQQESFTKQQVAACISRVTPISLNQVVEVAGGIELCCYYAGHVLGAVMFSVRVGNESVVYTGDYNTIPERHLGAASIPPLRPDLLITESTYATTLRDSRKAREQEFISEVVGTVEAGGKVLVPVFAVGRAQELLMLVSEYWSTNGLDVPVYMSVGLAAKANAFYRLMAGWGGEAVRDAALNGEDPFGLQRLKPWDSSLVNAAGPCVLFATPGMLHGGTSLQVFKAWCGSPNNLVVLPGYCAKGTVGNNLMSGKTKGLKLDDSGAVDVCCKIRYISFSAHADLRGIMSVVEHVAPRSVMLVHGDAEKMRFLADQIRKSLSLPVCMPANGSLTTIPTAGSLEVLVSRKLVASCREAQALKRMGGNGGSGLDGSETGATEQDGSEVGGSEEGGTERDGSKVGGSEQVDGRAGTRHSAAEGDGRAVRQKTLQRECVNEHAIKPTVKEKGSGAGGCGNECVVMNGVMVHCKHQGPLWEHRSALRDRGSRLPLLLSDEEACAVLGIAPHELGTCCGDIAGDDALADAMEIT